jgi:MoaA/NifB/PqqE/SkfB family radical SAM enzyme
MHDTFPLLEKIPFPAIRRGRLDTLQVNVGYRCNQSCVHCHVGASPHRTEAMSGEV